MKTAFAYSECLLCNLAGSQISFTYSYLSTKFGLFPNKFKEDMCISLKHVLILYMCYCAYLSV